MVRWASERFVKNLSTRIATHVAALLNFFLQDILQEVLNAIKYQGDQAVTAYSEAKVTLDKLVADIDVLKAARQADIDAAVAAGVAAATADKDAQIVTMQAEIDTLNAEFKTLQDEAATADAGIAPAPAPAPVPAPEPAPVDQPVDATQDPAAVGDVAA